MRLFITGILGLILGILWACDRISPAPVSLIFVFWLAFIIFTYKIEAWQKGKLQEAFKGETGPTDNSGSHPYRRFCSGHDNRHE
ncbi:MAG: hypothetical protein WC250_02170 [Candidatus Paceibacterota bacterium]